jgi:hypothetical protein
VPYSLTLIMDTPTIIALVAVAGSIATAVMTYIMTKSGVSREVIDNYKDLDKQNKDQLNEWKARTTKCEDLHREAIAKMGNMQGQLDTTLSILKDRNPETTKFMEYLTAVASRSDLFMDNSSKREDGILKALTEIGAFMKSLNDHMKNPSTTVNVSTPSPTPA